MSEALEVLRDSLFMQKQGALTEFARWLDKHDHLSAEEQLGLARCAEAVVAWAPTHPHPRWIATLISIWCECFETACPESRQFFSLMVNQSMSLTSVVRNITGIALLSFTACSLRLTTTAGAPLGGLMEFDGTQLHSPMFVCLRRHERGYRLHCTNIEGIEGEGCVTGYITYITYKEAGRV